MNYRIEFEKKSLNLRSFYGLANGTFFIMGDQLCNKTSINSYFNFEQYAHRNISNVYTMVIPRDVTIKVHE